MKYSNTSTWLMVPAQLLLAATVMFAVTPTNSKTFNSGEKAKIKGVIVSREGNTMTVRGDDDTIDKVDLSENTKIELKHGLFSHNKMDANALLPGLHIEAQGKGGANGDLDAEKVTFDPNSMKASRQIDARVAPLEGRTNSLEGRQGQLEGRAGQLESRAGAIEGRQKDLENTEQQTQQQVAVVKQTAEQANQGVTAANDRIGNLDNYTPSDSATVYFRSGSTVLTPQAKQDLDNLAQKAKNGKGYVIEVEGFADKTGPAALNQELSQRRANAVIQYLEEQGDIPVNRVLTPAGLGTSHEAADNKTSAGRKLNRRVEVKVLVNQGLIGSNATASTSPASSTTTTPGSTTNSTTAPGSTNSTGQGQTSTPPQQ